MPYIEEGIRYFLDPTEDANDASTPGELNFQLTRLVDRYIVHYGKSYAVIAEAISALECAKLELYRRIAAPYEDDKIKENGDVYES